MLTISFWFITITLLTLCALFILKEAFKNTSFQNNVATIIHGIKDSFKECGFHFPQKHYKVELYKYVITNDDSDICDDCREKSTWGEMDIADWMKVDVPKRPGPLEKCSGQCKCKLVLFKTKFPNPERK